MKLFVILSRVPWPLEKGDKLRAWYQLKELSKKHEICLVCISDSPIDTEARKQLEKFCKEVHIFRMHKAGMFFRLLLGLFSKLPFQVLYFHQKSIHRKTERIIARFKPDHIFCQLIRCSEYVKNIHHIPKTLDYMDSFSKGVERRIPLAGFFARPFFKSETRRLVEYENLIFDYFEHKCIITLQDRQNIYHPDQEQIAIIPNGVDFDFFHPIEREKKFDLVFNGNMNYPPNVDCVKYIAEEILPLAKLKGRELQFLISGASPSPEVLALAKLPGVKVSGWVDDQRESYASAKVFIAPFRIGTGLQNKLLEAMAMEIPCITSRLANNALKAEKDSMILVADQPEELVNSIFYLLDHPEISAQMASRGAAYIRETYNWSSSTSRLEQLMLS
ncbi:MAG: glycosyltransferase [Flavobacteriales bacterium]|nr:glycosyltransferase [Flavobacteriales bacterium]